MTDLDPLLKRLNLANTRRTIHDLVARAEAEDWSYQHFLLVLASEEIAHRRGTRMHKATRAAQFPFTRTIEEFDWTFQSTLRLTSIGSLLAPDFVTEGRNVILFGKPGRGKTHLAIAIAFRAIQNGFDVLFTTAADLIESLSTATRQGLLRDALDRFLRPHILVIDEVGYLSYGDDAANVLFHVVNERHVRKRSMIFTTNKNPASQWGDVLHDHDLAEAIVDRILERGRLLRLDGPSVRTKHLPPDERAGDDQGVRVSGKGGSEFLEPAGGGGPTPASPRSSNRVRVSTLRGVTRVPARCGAATASRPAAGRAVHERVETPQQAPRWHRATPRCGRGLCPCRFDG